MTLKVPTLSSQIREELTALVETGLYESEERFLADAVRTLLAARPDLREAIACKLYERGDFSLGRAAEWSDLSVATMKEVLHRRGITRQAPEDPVETEAMAREALKAAGRT
jgi:predicted HTH domain antitoxin